MKLQSPPVTTASTVKLFPRLAATRLATSTRLPNDRALVRARLLRMILDSERVRRHDRPSAS
jgi:hypothetical protein